MGIELDVIVVGAGPAGLTASLYCARGGLAVLALDHTGPGGQVMWCDNVENFPGAPPPISGPVLIERMRAQAESFGAQFRVAEVTRVAGGNNQPVTVVLAEGGSLTARALIIAAGAVPRRLGVPGEKELTGKGVSYCATCDANFFRGRDVLVAGGGDTAAQEALFLAKFCRKITLVHRRDQLRAVHHLGRRLAENKDQVSFLWNSRVVAIQGQDRVTGAIIENVHSGERNELACDGVFVFIGFLPRTGFLRDFLPFDADGYIVTDEEMATSVPGVFACGDARKRPLRQIITACADGAIAAQSALHYIQRLAGG